MSAWSYSVLKSFETCPRRHYLTKITKIVAEPQTEYTRHGNEVHKAMERALRGEEMLPAKYVHLAPIVQRCARAAGEKLIEHKWAVTEAFKPTAYFAKDVWCRGVMDYAVIRDDTAVVVDWKTGAPKPDSDQLKLFAAAMFALRPNVTRVFTGFAWLAHDRLMRDSYRREQTSELWGTFLPRVARIAAAERREEFPPTPSGLCRNHCPVPRRLCEHSGRT